MKLEERQSFKPTTIVNKQERIKELELVLMYGKQSVTQRERLFHEMFLLTKQWLNPRTEDQIVYLRDTKGRYATSSLTIEELTNQI